MIFLGVWGTQLWLGSLDVWHTPFSTLQGALRLESPLGPYGTYTYPSSL